MRLAAQQKGVPPDGYRIIPGFESYAISRDGVVLSCSVRGRTNRTGPWTYRKPRKNRYGYYQLALNCDGKPYTRTVHSLVLLAHCGPRPPGQHARHLDGNTTNNRIENLAWGTVSENAQDRVRHGTCHLSRRGLKHPRGRLSDDDVASIVDRCDSGEDKMSLAEEYGVTSKYIAELHRRRGRDSRKRVRRNG